MKYILFLALIAMTGLACTAQGGTTDPCARAARRDQYCKVWKALQGDAQAQLSLGEMYTQSKNYTEAFKWYHKAAVQGYADAQYNLGVMYDQGYGTPKNDVKAYMWLNLGASKTDGVAAATLRDVIEKGMTSSQIAKAQKATTECIRRHYQGC